MKSKEQKSEIYKGLLTLKEKMEIIEYKNNFIDVANTRIAEMFSVKFKKKINRRSIKNYMDNKEAITAAFVSNNDLNTIPRNFKFGDVDRRLKEWIDMIENQGGFLTDEIIKNKALSIFTALKKESKEDENKKEYEFKASSGWLSKFKRRYGFKVKQCSGEGFDVEKQNHDEFTSSTTKKIEEYGENNVFNCDETALFYKLAPSKSLVSKIRKGIKRYKDRITILLACNMSGTEKLKPVIIGKFKNPRAFKNFNKDYYCNYLYNTKAWMTSNDFNRWLFDINDSFKAKTEKY